MIIEELARHILESDFKAIDADTVEHAKKRIIDVVGCIIGGANAPGCKMLVDLVEEWGGREEATIAVHGIKVPAHSVAMVNSVMSRSYDYGPVIAYVEGKQVTCHISESTIPTTMTMAEWTHASGKEFLTTLIFGDDITARIITAGDKGGPPEGWEHAGIANVFGTTVIAGKFLDLNESQLISALGIALNQMGGTMQNIYDGAQEEQLQKVEAIILSMTPEERQNPNIIGGSRRRRIANGSGTRTSDINQLLGQFQQMQKLMKMGAKGKIPKNMMNMFQ